MDIQSRTHRYSDGDQTFAAHISWDASRTGPRPGVLISHTWRGRSDSENTRAQDMARLGYLGFALDLYGDGILGSSPEENRGLMQPFLDDRQKLLKNMQLALSEARELGEIDAARVAAIGFCFGGLCVLDLARAGSDLKGVASFHGLLEPPGPVAGKKFAGKALVLHGWDDPMARPEQLVALGQELTELGADWQIHAYGNTMHAFTNPAAEDPAHGLQFEPRANARSIQSLHWFLAECFR